MFQEYLEEGRSAHTDDIRKRPVFKQAIDDALAGSYDVLVVHKSDRFSRKLRVTLEYFEKLGKAGVGFVSIQNEIDYSTPTGKFMLVMQGGLAELYSDNLSQEVKKGLHERRAQGLYCGLLPFGASKDEDGIPTPDPDTSPGLKRGILKKCVTSQAVYPLSEQHGLKARERRYTAHEEGKHWE